MFFWKICIANVGLYAFLSPMICTMWNIQCCQEYLGKSKSNGQKVTQVKVQSNPLVPVLQSEKVKVILISFCWIPITIAESFSQSDTVTIIIKIK